MKAWRRVLVLLLLLGPVSVVRAGPGPDEGEGAGATDVGTEEEAVEAAAGGRVVEGEAFVGEDALIPGDLVEVEVVGFPDLAVRSEIGLEGKVALRYVGEVIAVGRTPAQLAEEIVGLYAPLYRDPRVVVRHVPAPNPFRDRDLNIYVLGEVHNAGRHRVEGPLDLLQALALAGGPALTGDAGRVGVVRREAGRTLVRMVDLPEAIVAAAAGTALPTVLPGDTIYIPTRVPQVISVLGDVRSPGRYEIQGSVPILEALGLGQGLLETAGRTLRIVRADGTTTNVDLDEALASTDVGDLPALAPGDALVVPTRRPVVFYVFGRVERPGRYTTDRPLRVHEAVAMAGGWTRFARVDETQQLTADGRRVRVKVERMIQEGRQMEIPPIGEGDSIYVP